MTVVEAEGELRLSSGGMGRVIQWVIDGRLVDTWAMHMDPGPSDELARRMARELMRYWARPSDADLEQAFYTYMCRPHSVLRPGQHARELMHLVRGQP